MIDKPTVHEALRRVMEQTGAVGKSGEMRGAGGTYKFRAIDDILQSVQPALIDHGVLFVPESTEIEEELRATGNGKSMQRVRLTVTWRVYGPAGDSITAVSVGEALDSFDKAANKAHTAAFKIVLGQVLCIPFSGDDQDNYQGEVSGHGWTEAKKRDAAELEDRLEHLPADICAALLDRMRVHCGDQTVEHVMDVGPEHLGKWKGLLKLAEEKVF
jgi:hypothetical protein